MASTWLTKFRPTHMGVCVSFRDDQVGGGEGRGAFCTSSGWGFGARQLELKREVRAALQNVLRKPTIVGFLPLNSPLNHPQKDTEHETHAHTHTHTQIGLSQHSGYGAPKWLGSFRFPLKANQEWVPQKQAHSASL